MHCGPLTLRHSLFFTPPSPVFPKILLCLKDADLQVRKHAATCIREVAKHTPELANIIVTNGGVGALVDYVSEVRAWDEREGGRWGGGGPPVGQ